MSKIVVFSHCGIMGGSTISLLDILRSIDKTLHEVVVYTKTQDSLDFYDEVTKLPNIRVEKMGDFPNIFSFYSGNEKMLLNPANLGILKRMHQTTQVVHQILLHEHPDLVVLNTMTLAYLGPTIQKLGIKSLLFDRETLGKEVFPIRNWYLKYWLRDCIDQVVYLTEYDRTQVQDSSGIIIGDCFFHNRNPLPKAIAQKIASSSTQQKILFLGGNSLIKGVETAIEALRYLPKTYHLYIAGVDQVIPDQAKHGWRRFYPFSTFYRYRRLYRLMMYHHLEERFTTLGFVSEVYDLMQQMDVILIPTLVQHQARAMIEAGFAKKIVVLSDMPCMQEVISKNTCYTAPMGDAQEFAKQIQYASTHPEVNIPKIENNLLWVQQHHDYEQLGSKLSKLFHDKV